MGRYLARHSLDEPAELRHLTHAMSVLSPHQVQVIVLRFGLRQELARIAASLDLSEEAVRLLEVRALQMLAGRMLPSACPPAHRQSG
jgi:DNA-directed RNA polymerase sigma subunit (sigma70/sigma32)